MKRKTAIWMCAVLALLPYAPALFRYAEAPAAGSWGVGTARLTI